MIIRQLAYLDALARERHFRKAAEACNVSQPTLSAAIAQLEREFGAQLVARGRRFEGLTREGEAVLAHARRVLAEVDAMGDALAELREGIGGRLTIGAVPTALPMIAGVTAPFLARYPGVALTILSQTSVEIQRGLDAFEIDVGLTYLDNEPLERVVSKPIYVEGYLLLTRADGPLASRDEIGWAEAARLRLCLLTPDMQNRRIVDGTFRSVGAAPVPVMETNSIFSLVSHAGVEGLASVVSEPVVDFIGLPAGVKALRLVKPMARRTVGLVAADRTHMPPLARKLFELARPLPPRRDGNGEATTKRR
ncbi:MAG: LysR family transcriptional regulator [Hyphomicrobiales bacterium]|nr:LysR family transcriptional regulator [Hyphomicrobiales bacterium]